MLVQSEAGERRSIEPPDVRRRVSGKQKLLEQADSNGAKYIDALLFIFAITAWLELNEKWHALFSRPGQFNSRGK